MRVVIAASFGRHDTVPTLELIGALVVVVVVGVAVVALLGWSLQRPRRALIR
jgi:hypothetical protein